MAEELDSFVQPLLEGPLEECLLRQARWQLARRLQQGLFQSFGLAEEVIRPVQQALVEASSVDAGLKLSAVFCGTSKAPGVHVIRFPSPVKPPAQAPCVRLRGIPWNATEQDLEFFCNQFNIIPLLNELHDASPRRMSLVKWATLGLLLLLPAAVGLRSSVHGLVLAIEGCVPSALQISTQGC